jgi:hypothetical protein
VRDRWRASDACRAMDAVTGDLPSSSFARGWQPHEIQHNPGAGGRSRVGLSVKPAGSSLPEQPPQRTHIPLSVPGEARLTLLAALKGPPGSA